LHFASTRTRRKRNRQIEADQIKSDEIFMETSFDGSRELPLESISDELECMLARKMKSRMAEVANVISCFCSSMSEGKGL
jgi:hypothetical protein